MLALIQTSCLHLKLECFSTMVFRLMVLRILANYSPVCEFFWLDTSFLTLLFIVETTGLNFYVCVAKIYVKALVCRGAIGACIHQVL